MPQPTVRLEDDGQGRVRPIDTGFNGTGVDIPLVAIAAVIDPRDVKSMKDGVSIGREQEGWFGPREDVNPGNFIVKGTTLATDGAGLLAATVLLAAPGVGKRYRVIATKIAQASGTSHVAGNASINSGVVTIHDKDGSVGIGGTQPASPCNAACPANTAITVQANGWVVSSEIEFEVTYRIEDVPV